MSIPRKLRRWTKAKSQRNRRRLMSLLRRMDWRENAGPILNRAEKARRKR